MRQDSSNPVTDLSITRAQANTQAPTQLILQSSNQAAAQGSQATKMTSELGDELQAPVRAGSRASIRARAEKLEEDDDMAEDPVFAEQLQAQEYGGINFPNTAASLDTNETTDIGHDNTNKVRPLKNQLFRDLDAQEWYQEKGKGRVLVVHHDRIRDDLFSFADTKAPPNYQYSKGVHYEDKTAYHPLYDYSDNQNDLNENSFQFRQFQNGQNSKKDIDYFKWNNQIVLDYRNRRMFDFKSLPLTISSAIEGWQLAAIFQSDSRIQWKDVLGRILYRGTMSEDIPRLERKLIKKARQFRTYPNFRSLELQDMESAVKWKIASLDQQDCDGNLMQPRKTKLPYAFLDDPSASNELEEFFLGATSADDHGNAIRIAATSDGLLDYSPVSATHRYLVRKFLKATRDDFVGSSILLCESAPPPTNDADSYFVQYETIQEAFVSLQVQAGVSWPDYKLRGLVSLGSTFMRWNHKKDSRIEGSGN